MSIYVCSDIHGQYDLYRIMLNEINFSDNDYMYILGDMIDRGPDGVQILQDVSMRPNVTCLIGNHELMMWNYISRHIFLQGNIWLHPANGGDLTLAAYKELPAAERRRLKEYIGDLYLQVEITVAGTTFLLSHSSFLPDYGTVKWRESGISKDDVTYVVWYSPWRHSEFTDPKAFSTDGRYHIIGHVPVLMLDKGYWPGFRMPKMPCFFHDPENHLVNIDLGCAMMPAIAANINDYEQEFIRTPSLCVMDLEKFARGEENPAIYIGIDGQRR